MCIRLPAYRRLLGPWFGFGFEAGGSACEVGNLRACMQTCAARGLPCLHRALSLSLPPRLNRFELVQPLCLLLATGDDTNYRGGDSGGELDLFGEVDKGDRRSCSPPGKVQGSLVYINGHPMKDGEIK